MDLTILSLAIGEGMEYNIDKVTGDLIPKKEVLDMIQRNITNEVAVL